MSLQYPENIEREILYRYAEHMATYGNVNQAKTFIIMLAENKNYNNGLWWLTMNPYNANVKWIQTQAKELQNEY